MVALHLQLQKSQTLLIKISYRKPNFTYVPHTVEIIQQVSFSKFVFLLIIDIMHVDNTRRKIGITKSAANTPANRSIYKK